MNLETSIVPADAGIGPSFGLVDTGILVLVPIVLLECLFIAHLLRRPVGQALKLSLVANLISTTIGFVLWMAFPAAGKLFFLELAICFVVTVAVEQAYLVRALQAVPWALVLKTTIGMNVASYVLLGAFMAFVVPHPGDRKFETISCAVNLKQIGLALRMYAADRDGEFPVELNSLVVEGYLSGTECFVCPSTKTRVLQRFTSQGQPHCGYVYKSPGKLDEATAAATIVAWDRPGNHVRFGNVLFGDGAVRAYYGEDWLNKARREVEIEPQE